MYDYKIPARIKSILFLLTFSCLGIGTGDFISGDIVCGIEFVAAGLISVYASRLFSRHCKQMADYLKEIEG